MEQCGWPRMLQNPILRPSPTLLFLTEMPGAEDKSPGPPKGHTVIAGPHPDPAETDPG